jgi:polar amino acid transport system substrate-binding protein
MSGTNLRARKKKCAAERVRYTRAMQRAWTTLCALIALAAGAWMMTACGPKTTTPIVIGMELNYPPFEMVDAAGNPSGVGVDLAHALADYLHRPLKIENMPFEGLIPALKTDRIDLIISSMTATAERAKSIDFSDPYLSTGLAILTKKNSPIQSIADIDKPGTIVVVKTGTTAATYAHDHFKNATTLALEQDTACALEVEQGKADAFLYDQMSIYQFAKKNPDTTHGLLEPFQKESWAIGIRKGNTDLENQVNTFLKDFKANGGFDKLGDKYLKDDKEAFRKMGFPFYF